MKKNSDEELNVTLSQNTLITQGEVIKCKESLAGSNHFPYSTEPKRALSDKECQGFKEDLREERSMELETGNTQKHVTNIHTDVGGDTTSSEKKSSFTIPSQISFLVVLFVFQVDVEISYQGAGTLWKQP